MIFDESDLKLLGLVLQRPVEHPESRIEAVRLLGEARDALRLATNPASELCRRLLDEMESRGIGSSTAVH